MSFCPIPYFVRGAGQHVETMTDSTSVNTSSFLTERRAGVSGDMLQQGCTYNFTFRTNRGGTNIIRGKFVDEFRHKMDPRILGRVVRLSHCRYVAASDKRLLVKNRGRGANFTCIINNFENVDNITSFVPVLEKVLPRLPQDCLRIIDQML